MTEARHLLGRSGSPFSRRHAVLLALSLPLVAEAAHAGSYLTRAAVLLEAAELESKTLRRRLHDKEYARLAHTIALARAAAARKMKVPKEVIQAHPHLLLVLESHERAANAALEGKHETFLLALHRAREERATFEAVLKQLGWTLPSV